MGRVEDVHLTLLVGDEDAALCRDDELAAYFATLKDFKMYSTTGFQIAASDSR